MRSAVCERVDAERVRIFGVSVMCGEFLQILRENEQALLVFVRRVGFIIFVDEGFKLGLEVV